MFQLTQKISWRIISYIGLLVSLLLTGAATFIIYKTVQKHFDESLRERLTSVVSTAALNFDADLLEKIQNPNDYKTDIYRDVVIKLQEIREVNKDVLYAYIMRKTNDANIFSFVADADSFDPSIPIDLNEDGIIDEEDKLSYPGDPYDATENSTLKESGLLFPITDNELTTDQWGTFLSAYSPIFNKDNKTAQELIGIDVDVSDYINLINLALFPFVLFIIFLALILSVLTFGLVHFWGSRVDLLKELDRQKDELLGLVSHQLATPVSAIKWNTEMMLDGDLGKFNKEQEESVKSLQNIAGDLSDLISMILDVSRIQLGRIRIDKQELDLKSFFKEILEIIEPKVSDRKIKFNIEMPETFPKAMLDKRYTHMTIENLLTNAVKYTPEKGTVNFTVKLRGDTLYCEVKDTGVGIPKADQDKIFGKLFRASNVKNTIDGNGFGLFVAKGAIEAQGGKIWFESEEGKGTTFFIELPLNSAGVAEVEKVKNK
jgi:signal transduction histidine kinase